MTRTALPSALQDELARIGRDLKTARLSRDMSLDEMAERLGVSFHTVRALEEGKPGTAFGTYAHALWVLGLEHTLRPFAAAGLDSEGEALRMAELRTTASGSRKLSNEF